MNVVILDTGCANLNSVKSAIARHGYEPKVSRDPDVVLLADKLFLPGVGTAQAAMDQVRERELFDLIKACTQPVLGICLGMQLLGRRSEESNGVDLLGIIDEDVPKMTDFGLPLPHMGWNRVYPQAGNRLFQGGGMQAVLVSSGGINQQNPVLLLCSQLRNAGQSVDHRPV